MCVHNISVRVLKWRETGGVGGDAFPSSPKSLKWKEKNAKVKFFLSCLRSPP